MKKVYSKPEIMFEDFALSTNVAANCQETALSAMYVCAVDYSGWSLFLMDMELCTDIKVGAEGDKDAEHDGLCYHVPYGNGLFMS